jgi:hypothetical protein
MVAITVVFLLAYRGRGAKAMQSADAPQFRLGAMAQQMGLAIVEGLFQGRDEILWRRPPMVTSSGESS